MQRNFKEMNEKLSKAAGIINPSQRQFQEFEKLASKYKDKSKDEIEAEMNKLINSFSKTEKQNLIKKLKVLQQMDDILDQEQKQKVDMFIKILSK